MHVGLVQGTMKGLSVNPHLVSVVRRRQQDAPLMKPISSNPTFVNATLDDLAAHWYSDRICLGLGLRRMPEGEG